MTQLPAPPVLRAAGETHIGKVRNANEDALIVEPQIGLYAVLDGMGGASSGDVASKLARETIRDFILHRRRTLEPGALIAAALEAGSIAVFLAAQHQPDRHGMGTTAVACLAVAPDRVVIGHVGDSRAYLWRAGRLQPLTRDHTVVAELVIRGVVTPEEARHHPHKNVLSRNLGGRAETHVDVAEVELAPGDRLLLCSDGLYNYVTADSIQYLLGSGDAPEDVSRDLIDLALRGGGGDNVSVVVIDAPAAAPSSTEMVRTSGAATWWQNRQRFLRLAHDSGLTKNPIVRELPAREALELVGMSLCQAIYHDLEKSTGVNVWTFAQNLAAGWFERGGDWSAVRALIDILSGAARMVVEEIRSVDPKLGFLLDVAVSRALIVVELALGGLLAERLRRVEADVIALHGEAHDTREHATREAIIRGRGHARESSVPAGDRDSEAQLVSRPTIPFLRPDRPVTSSGLSIDVRSAIGKTITIARARISSGDAALDGAIQALETIAIDSGGNFATAVLAARQLYGVRSADDSSIMPVFDTLDEARGLVATSVRQLRASPQIAVRVLRALSTAHQRLVGAATGLVLEAVAPHGDRLREAQAVTSRLRDAVAKAERQRADLERRFATIVDPNLPWGARGATEW